MQFTQYICEHCISYLVKVLSVVHLKIPIEYTIPEHVFVPGFTIKVTDKFIYDVINFISLKSPGFPFNKFLAKTLRVNKKLPGKSFSRIWQSDYKINDHNMSGVRRQAVILTEELKWPTIYICM